MTNDNMSRLKNATKEHEVPLTPVNNQETAQTEERKVLST